MRCQRLFATVCLVFATGSVCEARPGYEKRADAYLSEYAKNHLLMGSVLVARDGEVILKRAFGPAVAEFDVPNDPNTKFAIASITKQFTAAIVLQLVQKGQSGLDDPVGQHLREIPGSWKPVTIRQLLNRTSGIPGPAGLDDFPKGISLPYAPGELVSAMSGKEPAFEAGTDLLYSNTNYYLLGHLIESLTGKSLAECLQEMIFDPADMTDSGFMRAGVVVDQLALGYSMADGNITAALPYEKSIGYAAGAIYSTVTDLAKWSQALNEDIILPGELAEEMFTPNEFGYGFGWWIGEKNGKRIAYHGGGDPGIATFILRHLEDDIVVIVLANNDNSPARELSEHLRDLLLQQ